MSSLMDRLKKSGTIENTNTIKDSIFFNEKDLVTTDLPILNIAFSGDVDGGLVSGLTIFAGLSKSFKTLLGLYCMKAYLNKYPDAIALLYDSEYGLTPDYLTSIGIDTERVLHIPLEHVEELKFDFVKRLEEIKRGDKVFILVDSLGNLASKKETEDALDEKSVADLSRAKSIRSLMRLITPHLTTKNIPCIMINHIYNTMELYSKVVIPGGTAVTYSSNQIFVITKSQEKDGTDLIGFNFTINIEKSRYVREKSKLSFTVTYKNGIDKWSGLLDLGMEFGSIVKSGSWYQIVDFSTGELSESKLRSSNIPDEFYSNLLNDSKFKLFINEKYKVTSNQLLNNHDDSEL